MSIVSLTSCLPLQTFTSSTMVSYSGSSCSPLPGFCRLAGCVAVWGPEHCALDTGMGPCCTYTLYNRARYSRHRNGTLLYRHTLYQSPVLSTWEWDLVVSTHSIAEPGAINAGMGPCCTTHSVPEPGALDTGMGPCCTYTLYNRARCY